MPSVTQKLHEAGVAKPPAFVHSTIQYETMMGSIAYGCATDASDVDVYGFCVPPRKMVFPHLDGEIQGFGRQKKRFDQYQEHHLKLGEKEYDLSIYSIVRYFTLALENNPNLVDSLFTPLNCVIHSTQLGQMVRENRKLFLHKGSWHKFKGYSYSQLHKMESRTAGGKRKALIEEHGFDTKFAMHCVRLLGEVEQILTEGDIDMQRNNEHLKAIRRGEVPKEEIHRWFYEKEKILEKAYIESKLPYSPDEDAIKRLLLECLEHHYGSLDGCIIDEGRAVGAIRQAMEILQKGISEHK